MRDKCQACRGERGGVPGNENLVDGRTLCDYCTADLFERRAARHDEQRRNSPE